MNHSRDQIESIRSGVLDALRLLADPKAQIEYEVRVPNASVPAELFCIWSDDSYHPGSPLMEQAFSGPELAELARFDAVLCAASSSMPELFTVAELQARVEWVEVMKAAAAALSVLERTSL